MIPPVRELYFANASGTASIAAGATALATATQTNPITLVGHQGIWLSLCTARVQQSAPGQGFQGLVDVDLTFVFAAPAPLVAYPVRLPTRPRQALPGIAGLNPAFFTFDLDREVYLDFRSVTPSGRITSGQMQASAAVNNGAAGAQGYTIDFMLAWRWEDL